MSIINPEKLAEAGNSLNDKLERIRMAWSRQNRNAEVYSYVVDIFETDLVVKGGYDDANRKYYRLSYTDSENAVTFAPESDWQEVRLDYVSTAVTESDNTLLESLRGTIELQEADGKAPEAVIVVTGLNKKGTHEYTKEALQSGIGVFSGARMYADHPTMSEERDRPERSVRDLVGRLGEAYVGKDKHGNDALRAPMLISKTASWLSTLVSEGIADGLSIRAYGRGKPSDSGHMVVESFVENPHTSVDFVTVASAGGYPELSEAVRESFWSAVDLDTIRKHRPDLLEPVEESDGQPEIILLEESEMPDQKPEQLSEAASLRKEVAQLNNRLRAQEANGILADLLTPNIRQETRDKIQAQAKPLIEAYAASTETTLEQVRESLTAMVKAEKDYLAKIVPNGVVSGLSPESTKVVNVEEALTEAFTGLVPDDQVKIAVRGRS